MGSKHTRHTSRTHQYFADPEGKYGKQVNPTARTLEELDRKPCLALLGEPGIGKSYVVREYSNGLKARVGGDGAVLSVDCRWHHDLNLALFDTAPFRRWREDQAPLWLVLDSLDEYPAGPVAAAAKIIGELWSGPVEALRLRVACRTAEWPSVLDQQLPRLWESVGKDAPEDDKPVAFYALAPLRKVDVGEAVCRRCQAARVTRAANAGASSWGSNGSVRGAPGV